MHRQRRCIGVHTIGHLHLREDYTDQIFMKAVFFPIED
jgi:hypothetical protein